MIPACTETGSARAVDVYDCPKKGAKRRGKLGRCGVSFTLKSLNSLHYLLVAICLSMSRNPIDNAARIRQVAAPPACFIDMTASTSYGIPVIL